MNEVFVTMQNRAGQLICTRENVRTSIRGALDRLRPIQLGHNPAIPLIVQEMNGTVHRINIDKDGYISH